MKKNDTALGFVVLLISCIYFLLSMQLSPKAAMYPKFISMILGSLSLIFIIKTFLSKDKEDKKNVDFQTKQFFFVFSMAFVYIAIINILGYFISTFLFLVITLFGLKTNRKYAIATGVGFSLFVFVIFKLLLNVPVPRGFIF